MLFVEIIAEYRGNHTKHVNALSTKNELFLLTLKQVEHVETIVL
jgi:hypothetical protein